MASSQQKFIEEIEAFLAWSGMTATNFGRWCVKDPKFVFDLRAGRTPNLDTVDRVREFIDQRRAAAANGKAA